MQTRCLASNLGQPLVICVRDDAKQLLDTVAADRCDDAKLREMSPDGARPSLNAQHDLEPVRWQA